MTLSELTQLREIAKAAKVVVEDSDDDAAVVDSRSVAYVETSLVEILRAALSKYEKGVENGEAES